MTFTHSAGARNQYMEFSNSWAIPNKPSGLIVKLNADGSPTLGPHDDLSGKVVVDVTGWAPTAETLYFVTNPCTGEPYKNFTVIQGADVKLDEPDKAFRNNDRA